MSEHHRTSVSADDRPRTLGDFPSLTVLSAEADSRVIAVTADFDGRLTLYVSRHLAVGPAAELACVEWALGELAGRPGYAAMWTDGAPPMA